MVRKYCLYIAESDIMGGEQHCDNTCICHHFNYYNCYHCYSWGCWHGTTRHGMPTSYSLLCFLLCLLACTAVSAAIASASSGSDRSAVNWKKSNSLQINYPYHIFSGDQTHDQTHKRSDWRQGNRKSILPLDYFNFSRSQDQEDLWLYENWFYNLEGGVILESGALDGIKYSTSFLFEKIANYMSIHIEADPRNYRRLIRNREESINIQAALCSEPQLLHFTNDKGAEVQGFVEFMTPLFLKKFHNKIYKKTIPLSDLPTVKCVPINSILREINVKRIDIWILDIEGAELSVLQGMDFNAVSISAIVLECDQSDEVKDALKVDILTKNGYSCARVLRNYFCKLDTYLPSAAPESGRVYTGARNNNKT